MHHKTPTPPMGWNSFDSYGCYIDETAALANLEVMAQRLAPFGYRYFVIDNGWFAEYQLRPGTKYPAERHAAAVRLDEFGRYLPSQCYFPHGLDAIIRRTHELGLKFGIHIMRGISRRAVELNLPIKNSRYRARDVANTADTCRWCDYNYGVDMSRPGAQDFYDAWIGLLASWGVDFIKADDITGFPAEIEAIATAIGRSGREIILSLSPGNECELSRLDAYRRATMVRTTPDVWDNRVSLERCFAAWERWQNFGGEGFWPDLDMIPFGRLQLMTPYDPADALGMRLSGEGFARNCALSRSQQFTFITMRALAASPLFMGGDLLMLDDFSYRLLTNREMLACNQNGVVGKLLHRDGALDIWKTPHRSVPGEGWIGVFNRHETQPLTVALSASLLRLSEPVVIADIWGEKALGKLATPIHAVIEPDGVLFLRYRCAPAAS